jgi:hypothetical protein
MTALTYSCGPPLLEMSVFGALQPVADGTPASTG